MKLLCIGHAAYDTTVPVVQYPVENTKNRVEIRLENGGGPANNAAYLLGKWGMDVTLAGIVGKDLHGKKIQEELESVGVSTKYLEHNPDHITTSSFIIANMENGSRTILTYRPSAMVMKDVTLDFEPDIILIDGQEYEFSKKILTANQKAISIIDAGRPVEEVIELCHMVDYVVSSKEFAEEVTGITLIEDDMESFKQLYLKMETIFQTNIVVTLEAKGCLYRYQNKIKLMPSLKVKAVDSTGAGDIFHGAFTYGIANNYDYEDVLKIANIAGAISVTRVGSRNSMPTKEEMRMYYHDFK